jgi:hypothetical protein
MAKRPERTVATTPQSETGAPGKAVAGKARTGKASTKKAGTKKAGTSDGSTSEEALAGPCPTCGAPVRPIVYGMPDGTVLDAADRGEVFIGGCVIGSFPMASHICSGPSEHELIAGVRGRLVPIEAWDPERDGVWFP